MKYRKDIDGLRAIAVILVILCHLGFDSFKGGFLGVDIFFVISGFLITTNIVSKLNEGTFSFSNFYRNRVKRIAPVLIVILCLLTVFNVFVLLPGSLKNYLEFLPYSILGLGNIASSNLPSGYFDASTERYQLLHTWSLGVEEQFYLVVPVLFFLIWKIKNITYRNFLIVVIFLISILTSVYFVELTDDTKNSYYLLHTRFYEIFTGSILAIFFTKIPNIKNKYFGGGLHLLVIFGLVFLSMYYDGLSSWPGINGFIVSILSAAIIYLGRNGNPITISNVFLESNIMRFVGKISYSLYLWHWIIIASLIEIGYNVKEFSVLEKLGLVLVIFIPLSYVSWKFIENVFRYKFISKLRSGLLIWVLLPFGLSVGLMKWHKTNPYSFYSQNEIDETTYKLNHIKTPHIAVRNNKTTKDLSDSFKRSEYIIGDFVNRKKLMKVENVSYKDADVLILGNSHFHAFKDFVDRQLKEEKLIGHVLHESTTRVYSHKNAEKIYGDLLKGKKYLVMWIRPEGTKLGETNIDWKEWMIEKALKMGIQPIFYVSGIELSDEMEARKNIYYYKIFGEGPEENFNKCRMFSQIPSLASVQHLHDKYSNKVRWVDMKPLMCNNETCNLWMDGTFSFFDKHHITRSVGVKLGKEFDLKYGNMFSKFWKQPPVALKRNMYSEMNSSYVDKDGIFLKENGYEFYLSFLDKKFQIQKKYDSKRDSSTMFFFHIIPENLEELPDRRKKYQFDNLDVKGAVMETFLGDESIFYGRNNLPDYTIKSIRFGHFKPKGQKYFEKNFEIIK